MDKAIRPDERRAAEYQQAEGRPSPRRVPGVTMPGRGEATWHQVDGREMLLHLHVPDDGAARAAVVVMIPPGHEGIVNHRFAMALTARLVRAGLAVVRPAWTGASEAGQPRPDDVPAAQRWQAETLAAVDVAESMVPGQRPSVVSLGVMSTVAARALAGSGRHVDAFVMLAPVGRGKTYVRSRGALLGVAMVAEGLPVPDALDPERSASLPGLEYSAAEVEDWFALDLAGSWTPEDGWAADVVLINGPDAPADKSTRSFATAAGASTWTVEGLSMQLDRPALLALTRLDVADAVAEHLAERAPEQPHPVTLPTLRREAVVLRVGSEEVTEELLQVAGRPGTVTHAVGESRRVLVWATTAAEPHSGIGGVWARMARELARRGVTTVRVDLDGFGELVHVDEIRDPEPYDLAFAREFAEVVRWAAARFDVLPDVGGLCSGSWMALAAAGTVPVRSMLSVSHEAWTLHPEILAPTSMPGVALGAPAEPELAGEEAPGAASVTDRALQTLRTKFPSNPPYPVRRLLAARGKVQGVEPPLAAVTRLGAAVHLLLGDVDGSTFDQRGGDLAIAWTRRRGARITVERDHLVDHSALTGVAQRRILWWALGRLVD